MSKRIRCSLNIRSAWPIAPADDDSAIKSIRVAQETANKGLVATVSLQPICGSNRMSNSFARWALGVDGFALACQSTGAEEIGQVGTIVSCRKESPLWTAYFILDDLLDADLSLARSTWLLIAAMRNKLPVPWTNFVATALLGGGTSPRLGDGEGINREALPQICAARLDDGEDTSDAPNVTRSADNVRPLIESVDIAGTYLMSREYDLSSVSSFDSIAELTNTPGLSLSSTTGSIASFQEPGHDFDDVYSTSGSQDVPCQEPSTWLTHANDQALTAASQENPRFAGLPHMDHWGEDQDHSDESFPQSSENEHWVWDIDEERFHLKGRSEDDPGYWYPKEFA